MVMAHDPVADALHQLQQQVIGLDRQNKNITAKLNSLSDTVEQLQNQLTSRLGRWRNINHYKGYVVSGVVSQKNI